MIVSVILISTGERDPKSVENASAKNLEFESMRLRKAFKRSTRAARDGPMSSRKAACCSFRIAPGSSVAAFMRCHYARFLLRQRFASLQQGLQIAEYPSPSATALAV